MHFTIYQHYSHRTYCIFLQDGSNTRKIFYTFYIIGVPDTCNQTFHTPPLNYWQISIVPWSLVYIHRNSSLFHITSYVMFDQFIFFNLITFVINIRFKSCFRYTNNINPGNGLQLVHVVHVISFNLVKASAIQVIYLGALMRFIGGLQHCLSINVSNVFKYVHKVPLIVD